MKNDRERMQRDADDSNLMTDDENRDPLSGALGAHPVGTGVGAASGGAAGAAIGSVGGPIGAAVGLVAGAVAGGLAGKGVAEQIDPTVEDAYWRDEYANRAYYDRAQPYERYQSAYRTGYEGFGRYPGKTYEQVEMDLQRDYEKGRGDKGMTWENAKQATRDAWNRVKDSVSSDDSKRHAR